jgi:hypothetical protein
LPDPGDTGRDVVAQSGGHGVAPNRRRPFGG